MGHLESVTTTEDRIPKPLRLEWEATLTEDEENRRLSWQSIPGSQITHNGAVFFHAAPGDRGTEVKVILFYKKPPAGSAGAAAAKLLRLLTKNQLRADLRSFKAVLETGETPTTAGQPSCRAPQ